MKQKIFSWIVKDILSAGPGSVFVIFILLTTLIKWEYWTFIPVAGIVFLIFAFPIVHRMIRTLQVFVFFVTFFLFSLFLADFFLVFLCMAVVTSLIFLLIQALRSQYNLPLVPRWFKIGLILVVLVPFALSQILNIVGSRAISSTIEEAKKHECALNMKELEQFGKYQEIRPSENGGPLLVACGTILEQKFHELQKDDEIAKSDSFLNCSDYVSCPKRWNARELEQCKQFLKSCEDVLAIMEKALAMPQLRVPLTFPSKDVDIVKMELPYFSCLFCCIRTLSLQSLYFVQTGEPEKAVQKIGQIFKISDMIAEEPFLISYLIRLNMYRYGLKAISNVLISENSLKPEVLDMLQKMVADACHLKYYGLKFAIMSEVTYAYVAGTAPKSHWFFNRLEAGNISFFALFPFLGLAPQGWVKADVANLVHHHIELMEACSLEENKLWQKRKALRKKRPELLYPMSALLDPMWHTVLEKQFETLTMARCVWTGLELKKIQAKTGKLADSLSVIDQTKVPNITDPCSGKFLIYKISPEGRRIYGVGANEIEDNGILSDTMLELEQKSKAKPSYGYDVGIVIHE